MSRSYRKGAQIGDKEFKKIYNRRLRRAQLKNEEDLPQNGAYKKMNDPWDITDYRFEINEEDYKRWGYTEREFKRDRSK